jgi:YrbI family 3-deoxy-D-manno-octulosonate 8-phosphate phosphatase
MTPPNQPTPTNPDTQQTKNIVIIGSGHVATHLSLALKKAGYIITQVYSRNPAHAKALANQIPCNYTTQITEITPDADTYLFAVKDDALPKLITQLPPSNALWIHTAGSLPMHIFRHHTPQYGVLYPLQTLSSQRPLDLTHVPFFIEGNTPESENKIRQIAEKITHNTTALPSEKRAHLHLAAVFAGNFTNHMYTLAASILEKQQLDWHILLPLIHETVQKLHRLPPAQAQTGPAIRHDQRVMKQHLTLLDNEPLQELYRQISDNIQQTAPPHPQKSNPMINYDLKKIKAFLFDVDGVLSSNRIPLDPTGDPMRTVHIKDGYALQLAVKKGFEVGIITGGSTESVRIRYQRLGIRHIYLHSHIKSNDYEDFLLTTGLQDENILYCGDDLPDYPVMTRVGLPVAPADAAPEIKQIAKYISPLPGGDGIARDIIEQTLKIHGLWTPDATAFGW